MRIAYYVYINNKEGCLMMQTSSDFSTLDGGEACVHPEKNLWKKYEYDCIAVEAMAVYLQLIWA